MWSALNRFVKDNCPRSYEFLKVKAGPWFRGEVGYPILRRIGKHVVWTQPRLALAETPEPHILRWIEASLSVGNTFFDVGAHCGWMSMAAARRVGSTGCVVAFEPSPPLIEILSYHKNANQIVQMEIAQFAVSDRDRCSTLFFLVNGGLSYRNSLTIGSTDTPHVNPLEKTSLQVPSISLDGYVKNSGRIPNLIKIDVEGAELLVLQGAENLLERFHPRLIVGVHPFWLPRSQSVGQLVEFLYRHGYRIEEEIKVEFDGGYIADYLCCFDP